MFVAPIERRSKSSDLRSLSAVGVGSQEKIFRKNYAVSVIGKVPRGRMISPPGIISDVNNYNFLCTLTVYTTEDFVQFEGISETGKYLLTRESRGIEKLKSDFFS